MTEKAWEIKVELFSVLKSWTEVLSRNLSEEERMQFLSLLEKVAQNAARFAEAAKFDEKGKEK